jgi:hypothetical protein
MNTVLAASLPILVAPSRPSIPAVSSRNAQIAHDDVLQAETWAPPTNEVTGLDELPSLRGKGHLAWKPDGVADALNMVFASYGR